MLRCGECGLLVTAEHKINRHGSKYTYYHCTRRKFDYCCRQRSITAQHLDDQITAFIRGLVVPAQIELWIQLRLKKNDALRKEMEERRMQSLHSALADTERSLSNLTSLRIRDLIDDKEYIQERSALERDRLRLQQEVQLGAQTEGAFEPFERLISFRNRATAWFQAGDVATKRLILQTVGSTPVLKDKLVSIQAKKPFVIASSGMTFPQLRAAVEDVRTLFIKKDPELMTILENIKKLEIKFGIQSEDDPHVNRRLAG
jgi:site-specific DNA recombinase